VEVLVLKVEALQLQFQALQATVNMALGAGVVVFLALFGYLWSLNNRLHRSEIESSRGIGRVNDSMRVVASRLEAIDTSLISTGSGGALERMKSTPKTL